MATKSKNGFIFRPSRKSIVIEPRICSRGIIIVCMVKWLRSRSVLFTLIAIACYECINRLLHEYSHTIGY